MAGQSVYNKDKLGSYCSVLCEFRCHLPVSYTHLLPSFFDDWEGNSMAEYITHSRAETVALGKRMAAVLQLSLIHI